MVRPRPLIVLLFAAFAMAAGAVGAATPPNVSISSAAQLPTPLPYPYDEHADADATVAKAKALARATHRLLLIELGGDWCPDCRVLAGVVALPEVKAFVDQHYVVVTVDVGRFDRNLKIPAAYGIHGRLQGVPSLLVVDPDSDALLNAGHVFALSDARTMSPQSLADYLALWTH